jgi:hypothetical protein
VTILGRSLRVDHVEQYRLPKKLQEQEQDASEMGGKPATSIDNDNGTGHAYKGMEFENNYNIQQGMDLFAPQTPAKDKKYLKTSGGTDENKEHSAKIKRKEDRQQKRLEKEERRQRREERKEKDEEKRRKKRAREYYGDREAVKKYKRAR